MTTAKPMLPPTAKSIAAYVRKNADKVKGASMHHHAPSATVREAEYKGHHIVVRTTYEITVDDRPMTGHMGVGNDGQVHYHPVPNMSFASAVDLVKQLIDVFPDDFDQDTAPNNPHGPEHEHPMPMGKSKSRPKTKASTRSKPKTAKKAAKKTARKAKSSSTHKHK